MERFDAYMERCLYGEGGFYATTGRAGRRRGDFVTSPEVGPLFGAVLADAIDGWWNDLGRPGDFTVFDVGAGPGSLLRSMDRALTGSDRNRPWRLVNIDPAAAGRGRSDYYAPGLPDDLSVAVVVANELLDNLPFRVLAMGDGPDQWREIHVEDGVEIEVVVPADDPASAMLGSLSGLETLTPGTRVPVLDAAASWVNRILARHPARLLVFDYGTHTTVELARRGGWLRTYQGHRRGSDPLHQPGRWDITTDIAVDQLPNPVRVCTQREFLIETGIERLVDEGREYWRATAHRPDVTALMMRSRVSESEALLDPRGLGSWLVLQWATSDAAH